MANEEIMETIRENITHFVLENFLFTSTDKTINCDASLIDMGIVDSTGILEIVNFIEETFGLKVDDEDIVPENLESINRITKYINRKAPLVDKS